MAKQLRIAGTQRNDRNEQVENAAAAYQEAKEKRMELTEKEVETKDLLLHAMKENKLKYYRCSDIDLEVTVVPGEAKVKTSVVEVTTPTDEDDEKKPEDGE